jgi:hypothetical protein
VQGQHERRVTAARLAGVGRRHRRDRPNEALKDGRYLRRTAPYAHDEDGRWSVFVLEDDEQLLSEETSGAPMGELDSPPTDGLLGQGLR